MTTSTPLATVEQDALRRSGHRVKRYLSVAPLFVQASARVNQAEFDPSIAVLIVNTASGTWGDAYLRGCTAWIGTAPDTRDIFVGRVRDTDADHLYLMQTSKGDVGMLARREIVPIQDDAYISIFNDYNIWSIRPRIGFVGDVDFRTGTFYKDYLVAYTDQNEDTPPPIVNIGEHQAGWVDGSGNLAIERAASVHCWVGSVDTYEWFINEVSVGSDSPTLSTTVTAGYHILKLVVTLTTGAVATAIRCIFAHDAAYPPRDIEITSDNRDEFGRHMGFKLIDGLDTLEDGCMALYWEEAYTTLYYQLSSTTTDTDTTVVLASTATLVAGMAVSGTGIPAGATIASIDSGTNITLSAAATASGTVTLTYTMPDYTPPSLTTQMVGFAKSVDKSSAAGGIKEQSFEFVSAAEICKQLTAASQQLTTAAIPANWQEVIESLAHIDFWVWYLMRYHSSVLTLFDLELSGMELLTLAWGTTHPTLTEQWMRAGDRVNVQIGQDSDGSLILARDPQLTLDRSGLVSKGTLTENDIAYIKMRSTLRPAYGSVKASGFAIAEGEFVGFTAQASSLIEGQGYQEGNLENQLVENLYDLQTRAMLELARLNNPEADIEFGFETANYDVFEPCRHDIWLLDVDSPYWLTDDSYTGYIKIKTVNISHLPDGVKRITCTAEALVDTNAIQAQALPYGELPDESYNAPLLAGNSYTPIPPYDPLTNLLAINRDPFLPNPSSLPAPSPAVPSYMLGWGGAKLFYTANASSSSPSWTSFLTVTGTVTRAIHSWKSPFLSDNTADLWLWAVSPENGLYYADGAIGTTPSLIAALDGYVYLRNIRGQADGLGICGFGTKTGDNGHWFFYSPDAGTTVTETRMGDIATGADGYDDDIDDYLLGVAIGAADNQIVYTDGDYEGSFNILAGLSGSGGTDGSIVICRVPYLTVGGTPNDDPTALEFVYGIGGLAGGVASLWRVVFNSTSGALISETDITPHISGTYYSSTQGFEISGFDGTTMLGFFDADPSGGDFSLLKRAGSTWSNLVTPKPGAFVRWKDGSRTVAWLCGSTFIEKTTNGGSIRSSKLGDFPESVIGAYGF